MASPFVERGCNLISSNLSESEGESQKSKKCFEVTFVKCHLILARQVYRFQAHLLMLLSFCDLSNNFQSQDSIPEGA